MDRQISKCFPYKRLAHIKEKLEILLNKEQVESVSSIYKALELLEGITYHFSFIREEEIEASQLVLRSINLLFLKFCFITILEMYSLIISLREEARFLPVYHFLIEDIRYTKEKVKIICRRFS